MRPAIDARRSRRARERATRDVFARSSNRRATGAPASRCCITKRRTTRFGATYSAYCNPRHRDGTLSRAVDPSHENRHNRICTDNKQTVIKKMIGQYRLRTLPDYLSVDKQIHILEFRIHKEICPPFWSAIAPDRGKP
ncbi:hypothetical protein [Burkholderia singularis]|uniref:hypothetical protein n=1 Tax=Burkholderia singularis TaxID=1503053 RepID=UPI000B2CCCC7|nr:hypothetical protein [Burkholderia singularis]